MFRLPDEDRQESNSVEAHTGVPFLGELESPFLGEPPEGGQNSFATSPQTLEFDLDRFLNSDLDLLPPGALQANAAPPPSAASLPSEQKPGNKDEKAESESKSNPVFCSVNFGSLPERPQIDFTKKDLDELTKELAALPPENHQIVFEAVMLHILHCCGNNKYRKCKVQNPHKNDNPISILFNKNLDTLLKFLLAIDHLYWETGCTASNSLNYPPYNQRILELIKILSTAFGNIYQPKEGDLFNQLRTLNVNEKCPSFFPKIDKPCGYVIRGLKKYSKLTPSAACSLFNPRDSTKRKAEIDLDNQKSMGELIEALSERDDTFLVALVANVRAAKKAKTHAP